MWTQLSHTSWWNTPRYLAICRKYYSNPSMLGMLKKTDDFSVNKLMYLQEIGWCSQIPQEFNKTYCQLHPINISKLESTCASAAPFIADINHSFRESNFVVSEKKALIRPYLKKVGVDSNEMINYHSVATLTYLSKIIERAILDQLRPFLERGGVIFQCQSVCLQKVSFN